MTDFEKVMINRDGMSKDEAHEELMNLRYEVLNGDCAIEDIEDIEDILLDEYGLELDYLMDILF